MKNLFRVLLFVFVIIFLFVFLYFDDSNDLIEKSFAKKDYANTLDIVNNVLDANKDNINALEYKARVYIVYSLQYTKYLNQFESEYLDRAIGILNSLTNLFKEKRFFDYDSSRVYFLLGFAFFLKGKYDLSLNYLEHSLSIGKENIIQFINNSGFELFFNGKPYNFSAYSLLGYIAYKLSDYSKSIYYFSKVIDYEDNGSMIHRFYLAILYDFVGNIDNAISEYKKVILKEDNSLIRVRSCVLLSKIFIKRKDYVNARKYLYQANIISPSADILYYIGNVYQMEGDISLALLKWREALKFDYDHSLSHVKLKRFSLKYKNKS